MNYVSKRYELIKIFYIYNGRLVLDFLVLIINHICVTVDRIGYNWYGVKRISAFELMPIRHNNITSK